MSSLRTPPPPPRLSSSRSAISSSARRNASTSRLADVGDEPVGGERRHPQALLELRGGLPGRERLGDRERVAQAADHAVEQARASARPAARSSSSARVAVRWSPATSASASVQILRSAELAEDGLDLLDAELRAGAVLERELLELAQQPLLAVADVGDQRPGGLLVEVDAQLRGARDEPARELPRLDRRSPRRSARRPSRPPCAARPGTLSRPSSRPKNATVSVSASMLLHRGGDGLDVGVLPALDAVGDDEAAAERERHRATARPPPRRACRRRPRAARRRRRRSRCSAIARRRVRRSAMRPWSSPWMR